MRAAALVSTLAFTLACMSGTEVGTDPAPVPADPVVAPAPTTPATATAIELRPIASPTGTVVGTFDHAIGWTDANGDNQVVFSYEDVAPTGTDTDGGPGRKLYAVHTATKDGVTTELRAVQDAEVDCPYDLLVSFIDGATKVTDLDADGIGEVTFAYRLNCASDVSPGQQKLLLLENGDKYILRGTYRVRVGAGPTDVIGGEYEADEAVLSGPPAFRAALETAWPPLADQSSW